MSAVRRGVWARGEGLTLLPSGVALGEPLARALRDGVERGYEGEVPPAPPGTLCMTVRVDGAEVGLIAFQRDHPSRDAVTVHAVAIEAERRGNGYGTRALLVAERRLRRDGVERFFARVPRGNGRGLYFMLRAGYAPVAPPLAPSVDDGATWFRRFEG